MEVLLVLHLIIIISLVGVILMQPSSADGIVSMNNSLSSFLGGRAAANFMTRLTAILATAFILNSLVLAYMASHTEREASLIEALENETPVTEEPPVEKLQIPDVDEADNVPSMRDAAPQDAGDNTNVNPVIPDVE